MLINGKIKGIVYDIGDYPGCRSKQPENHLLLVKLYAIKNEDEFDWAIAQLDDYEGVDAKQEKMLYSKENRPKYI